MPDFGSISPSALRLSRCSAIRRKQHLEKEIVDEEFKSIESANHFKSLDDCVSEWIWRKAEPGDDKLEYFFPFLVGSKKLIECLSCRIPVVSSQRLHCSVRSCDAVFHVSCARRIFGEASVKKFKCPHHECFLCKQKFHWKCVRCTVASHEKCAPWPEKVVHLKGLSGRAICWKHTADWRLEIGQSAPSTNIEEVFHRLPLPYIDEDFNVNSLPDDADDTVNSEPPPYTHIKRNVYLIKKKHVEADYEVGCTNCTPECSDECVCRVQCVSCSKACKCECSGNCNNRPFRKEKKTKIVKTALCGWGVEAVEPINKKDFIIEYIGEVIDDALCEQRLWDMKYRGVKNFYMCEIRKDFTIDATFKGNTSRFLNHCCDPNCVLEKWQVGEETRVGVFAARDIKGGEPLTYDYRFVQFGADVKCYCGAANCQGFLGSRRKPSELVTGWGAKRRRSIA